MRALYLFLSIFSLSIYFLLLNGNGQVSRVPEDLKIERQNLTKILNTIDIGQKRRFRLKQNFHKLEGLEKLNAQYELRSLRKQSNLLWLKRNQTIKVIEYLDSVENRE
jgi:hypothetical protein